jgi:DNA primase
LHTTRQSLLGSATTPVEEALREAVILATLITHPRLITRFESALETLDCTGEGHGLIRDLLLAHADAPDPKDAIARAAPAPLDVLLSHPHVRNAPALLDTADTERAEFALAQDFFILQAERGRRREIEEAEQDIEGVVDEGLTWRIAKANEARAAAHRGPQDKIGEAVISSNGVALDKEELEEARKVFDSIRFDRPSRRH